MKPNFKGTRFEGDGRKMIGPTVDKRSEVGIKTAKATIRDAVEIFLSSGSCHLELFIWAIKEYCEIKGLKYKEESGSIYLIKDQNGI